MHKVIHTTSHPIVYNCTTLSFKMNRGNNIALYMRYECVSTSDKISCIHSDCQK